MQLTPAAQDCADRNALIRALAIRTMSSIPLPPIISALVDPLRHALEDQDPYVRKTGAIALVPLAASRRAVLMIIVSPSCTLVMSVAMSWRRRDSLPC